MSYYHMKTRVHQTVWSAGLKLETLRRKTNMMLICNTTQSPTVLGDALLDCLVEAKTLLQQITTYPLFKQQYTND